MSRCIIIPAIKKDVAFVDDLIKKLAGTTLIQRAINMALELVESEDLFIVTDSEEISLISQRNNLKYFYDATISLNFADAPKIILELDAKLVQQYEHCVILWPYTPMLDASALESAYSVFKNNNTSLVSVRESSVDFKRGEDGVLKKYSKEFCHYAKAFWILNTKETDFDITGYTLDKKVVEIKSYHDWWVCEKLLKRKRIVIRFIGSQDVGSGHILRCLAIAHEVSDHEIVIVIEKEQSEFIQQIAGEEYFILEYEKDEIEQSIIDLNPDLVINDILDSDASYIKALKKHRIKVVNFEDEGSGSQNTDLTINALYDKSLSKQKNIRCGYKYFFLRDEFIEASKNKFKKVTDVLVTFGGTDPNNLTLITLKEILPICKQKNIHIHVVAGGGYAYEAELLDFLSKNPGENITYTKKTGIISQIMEKVQLAVSANGRTVFELVHMNIPSIVISQHTRENLHTFSSKGTGCIYL
ncbi:MAG: hypothetical protein NE327_14025, partial [Lentisphaeraceae bacterium]|nr:hypothetical protein [Lentisphaeraceae bacterium]